MHYIYPHIVTRMTQLKIWPVFTGTSQLEVITLLCNTNTNLSTITKSTMSRVVLKNVTNQNQPNPDLLEDKFKIVRKNVEMTK